MEPKTLSAMSPSEQQLKNRLLASGNGGTLPGTGTDYSALESANTYNPKSIMDTYSSARKLTTDSAASTAKRLNSEYSTAVDDTNISDTKDTTSTLEGQTGFAQMPVALNYMQIAHDKRIRDLTKQKNELLLANESDKSKSLSDLIIKEETAMSDAKTNFLTNYFNINKEKRDSASFQTPDQKAIQTLQATAPDANILSTDTYQQAIEKYKGSETYKRNVRKGEADIKAVEANIRQSDAAAAKSLSDANGGSVIPYNGDFDATIKLASQQGETNDQRKQIQNNLQTFITNKDYPSAYTQIVNSTSNGLKGTAATTFQQQNNSLGVLDSLKTAMEAYKASGGNTNIFKGTADEIQTKIGALLTNPKYASLAVQMNAAFQNYRLQMTGAAFGPKESAEYAAILPSPGNTLDLNLAKLEGAKNYLNSSVETSIKNVVGPGGLEIKKYAEGATPSGSSGGDKSLSAPTFQGFKLKF